MAERTGARLLNKTTRKVIGEISGYDDIVNRLAEIGVDVDRKRLQIWFHRNNYGLRDLSAKDDADGNPMPLFHWPTAGPILIDRVTSNR